MSDLIERQAVIDVVASFDILDGHTDQQELIYRIRQLPSSQPEIIHCRECVNARWDNIFHQCWCHGRLVTPDHYCGYAERRTNGVDR